MSFARAVRGSNWIEGYRASLDDVLDAIEGEEPLGATAETRAAVAGYRHALTYVLQLAETGPRIDGSLLNALHFNRGHCRDASTKPSTSTTASPDSSTATTCRIVRQERWQTRPGAVDSAGRSVRSQDAQLRRAVIVSGPLR